MHLDSVKFMVFSYCPNIVKAAQLHRTLCVIITRTPVAFKTEISTIVLTRNGD
jgi:hypothetical protein